MPTTETVRVRVRGRVQGVSYRAWTRDAALRLGLAGWVRNEPDGSVTAVLSGPPETVAAMLAEMRDGPPAAAVHDVATEPSEEATHAGFTVRR